MNNDNILVVTRHPALVDLLIERGIIGRNTPVVAHVGDDDVIGKDVIGVLPLRLAAMANTVTEIPLALTAAHRGVELDLDTIRSIAAEAATYSVKAVR